MQSGFAEHLLVERFSVTPQDLQKAKMFQKRNGGRLELILIRLGVLSADNLPHFYSAIFDIPVCEYASIDANVKVELAIQQINQLLEFGIIPLSIVTESNSLNVLLKDPSDISANEYLASLSYNIVPVIASEVLYDQLSKEFDDSIEQSDIDLSSLEEDKLREMASEAPTVNLLNNLISKGLKKRASDMHVEPILNKARVRYRVDGVLIDADILPSHLAVPVTTRLKLLAGMDIAEKRRPQDGKIELKVDGYTVDIRVSALPVAGGESIVMRFLLKNALEYDIKKLGIEPDIEQLLLEDIDKTSGVVLLTGPTGSGKTTSLYSFLSIRNKPGVKIITIEDPVEYQLSGINQVQVQSDIGFTFANALRSVVRQDPDIIMVGEIRDNETASIALQSALTGHLVLSTLHTNDAASAFTRLLDLGVEPFLLSAAVKSVVAQRLVRQLCQHCSTPDGTILDRLKSAGFTSLLKNTAIEADCRKPVGCDSCAGTGFAGRVAIIEYMRCDEDISALLTSANFVSKANQINHQKGRRNLVEDGVLKVLKGLTTLDEVFRVAG